MQDFAFDPVIVCIALYLSTQYFNALVNFRPLVESLALFQMVAHALEEMAGRHIRATYACFPTKTLAKMQAVLCAIMNFCLMPQRLQDGFLCSPVIEASCMCFPTKET
jgi:hypothetical protein